jgi:hypothetical protein
MAGNGLDSGDSIRSSDKLRFFRGWNTDSSAGERNVRFSDLVTFLNSPDSGLSGGGGGVSSEDISRLEKNIGLNSLRDAVNGGWAYFNMVDGVADVFTDETGVNTGSATNATYNAAGDFYGPTPASSATLLIQSDTTDGSTTFTDEAGSKTVTANGDAQHDTAQAQFGASSMLFDGTGDYLSIPANADFAFGTGDFTIDMWLRPNSVSGNQNIIGTTPTGIDEGWLIRLEGGNIRFYLLDGGTFGLLSTATLSVGTWYHIAVVRSGTDVDLYIDGVSDASGTTSADNNTTNRTFSLGAQLNASDVASVEYDGWMDEVRIVKGTAAWTANFTPPTAAYNLGTTNMTLPSIEFTTTATPTAARGVVLYDPIDAVTLNTDLILEYSRDGGTTWTAATLEAEATFSGNVEILATEDVDISGQPVGATSIIWRIRTDNTKNLEIHGVYTQWR